MEDSMENPYQVMAVLKKKVDLMVIGEEPKTFTDDEVLVIKAALDYGTTEWWETLKIKKRRTR
jgi:hypothetical protein